MAKKNFYAVKKGKTPGVYTTWDECSANVTGFNNAQYKGFSTLTEAQAYIRENASTDTNTQGNNTPAQLNTSTTTNTHGQDNIHTISNTQDINMFAQLKTHTLRDTSSQLHTLGRFIQDETHVMRQKRVHTTHTKPYNSHNTRDTTSGVYTAHTTRTHTSYSPMIVNRRDTPREVYEVHTDGACSNNGQTGSRGGIGVFFSKDNSLNISERLVGTPQTNNRAELTAIIRTLEVYPYQTDLRIYSDSMYCINGIQKWMGNWEMNGWKKSDGSEVLNCDLWTKMFHTLGSLTVRCEFVRESITPHSRCTSKPIQVYTAMNKPINSLNSVP